MPAKDLFLRYQEDLAISDRWWISGEHYARTCEAWLQRLDASESEALQILESIPNADAAGVMLQRWRMFFMACAELFRFDGGREWGVGHYLFDVRQPLGSAS